MRAGAGVASEQTHVPLRWRKSSASATDNCVEIATGGEAVHVRDSKDPDGPVLTFTIAGWRRFVADVDALRANG
jgi:hypothetical protein